MSCAESLRLLHCVFLLCPSGKGTWYIIFLDTFYCIYYYHCTYLKQVRRLVIPIHFSSVLGCKHHMSQAWRVWFFFNIVIGSKP
jgi:hypothetical protein